jgi:uncharacterized protein Yka (UPF0111/DUF47 family)
VALRFKPVDNAFYTLLSNSAGQLVLGTGILAELLGEHVDRVAVADRMRDAEHQADEITHEIAKRVNSTFVTPVLYEVNALPAELAEQVDVLQRCAELTAEAMPQLKSMKGLEEYWIEINRLENAGDKSYRRILAKLFSGQYEALEVLKLKDIVDSLEHAVDAFEKVANIIEQIHAKES